jgi:inner membrane transporter RhtA
MVAETERPERLPPAAYFITSAVFHYAGPAMAVLLFARLAPLGVAWLRIVSAGVVFACWRRPWRVLRAADAGELVLLGCLGGVLAAMNACFYLAIARLPLATVGAMEFLGPVALAAAGVRTRRNLVALVSAVAGVGLLTDARLAGAAWGFVFASANLVGFLLYIVLGHRIAERGGAAGVDRLAAAMLVACVAVTPLGVTAAVPALTDPVLLGAGVGVGVSSSVIPYVCDQLAMARLRRSSFAVMLALLPATATVIGVLVLRQIPRPAEVGGLVLVIAGVALHDDPPRDG